MAADTLRVEIVTPERAVFNDVASQVVIPGTVGELGVLPGHLPLLTAIGVGDLAVHSGGQVRHFFIDGGYAEILPDRVAILTENAEGFDELDLAEARRQLEAAEQQVRKLEERSRTEEVEAGVEARHHDALERARRRVLFAEQQ